MLFSELPDEIIEQVLLHTDHRSLTRCRVVSKQLHELVRSSVLLQIVIEAAVDGLLVVGPRNRPLGHPSSSAQHVLDEIFRTREATEKFMPRSAWGIPYPARNFHWEISDGILCFTSGGWDGQPPKTLHFNELLAPTDDQYNPFELDSTGRRYTRIIQDTGVGISDVVFSTGLDLVVLLERRVTPNTGSRVYRLHFKSISTGGTHPDAASPSVESSSGPPQFPGLESWTTQIYGNIVTLLLVQFNDFVQRRGGVIVWDWKSGRTVVPFQRAVASMCLSEDQLLLAVDTKEDSSLWNDPTNLNLVVYSITKKCITHRINLPLSTIPSPILYTYPRQSISQIPLAQTAGTFAPDPSLDIFTLEFWPNDGLNAPCIVVFSTLRLLKACDAATLQGGGNYPMVVDWDTWGPRASRWFPPHTLRPPSERAVHGARMVIYTRSDAFDVSDDITNWGVHDPATYNTPVILDFNPRPVLRGATDCDHRWCRNTVVRDPWTWRMKDGDREVTIESALPFRAFVNKEEWHHSDLQLHSTALVCAREQSHDIFSFLMPAGSSTRVDAEI